MLPRNDAAESGSLGSGRCGVCRVEVLDARTLRRTPATPPGQLHGKWVFLQSDTTSGVEPTPCGHVPGSSGPVRCIAAEKWAMSETPSYHGRGAGTLVPAPPPPFPSPPRHAGPPPALPAAIRTVQFASLSLGGRSAAKLARKDSAGGTGLQRATCPLTRGSLALAGRSAAASKGSSGGDAVGITAAGNASSFPPHEVESVSVRAPM
ncbi:hypothetical protein DFJ74DRAFT_279652 [Hyaloraphidium curvatum]|nr:hypothetical protein DFJ74DRAFT_279652 [Hyaloraphidium curvatum]